MAGSLERALKRLAVTILRPLARDRAGTGSPPSSPGSLLVVRQHDQLGDMLCVVPLLRALRQAYPSARIWLMTSPVNDAVMQGNRYLDGTMNFDKRQFLPGGRIRLGRLLHFVRSLRQRAFDLVIVPATVSTSFTSDLLAYLTGAPVRIGPASLDGRENPSGFVYTEKVELDWRQDESRHQTLRNLDIAGPLHLPCPALSAEITLCMKEETLARQLLAPLLVKPRPIIAFHPGAGKPPNRWPAESFAEAAIRLAREVGAQIVITAGPMDEEPLTRMRAAMNLPAIVLRNEPIRVVSAVLKQVDLLITNDTGIMHVGAASGCPVLSLFGPTSPEQWAPVGEQHRALKGEEGRIDRIPVESVVSTALGMIGPGACSGKHDEKADPATGAGV